jgi:hypothetical protein
MPARRTKPAPHTATARRAAPTAARQPAPAVAGVWERFAEQLQQCVSHLETDDILILARKRANVYVQLHHCGFGLALEATSNAYIAPPTALLTEREYARAIALGWHPPTVTPEVAQELRRVDESYDGSPNFYRDFELGEPGLVDLIIATLRHVYRVGCPTALEYKSFTADGASQIRWTGLSIKRALV